MDDEPSKLEVLGRKILKPKQAVITIRMTPEFRKHLNDQAKHLNTSVNELCLQHLAFCTLFDRTKNERIVLLSGPSGTKLTQEEIESIDIANTERNELEYASSQETTGDNPNGIIEGNRIIERETA